MALAALPLPAKVQILRSDDAHAIAFTGRTLVAYWQTETREPAVNELASLLAGFATEFGRVGLLQIIDDRAIPPNGATRAALAAMLKNNEAQLTASAVVFEGAGFRASVVRSIVIGIGMLSRLKCPHLIFATTGEGIAWLSAQLSGAHSAPQSARGMQLAVDQLRERVRLVSA